MYRARGDLRMLPYHCDLSPAQKLRILADTERAVDVTGTLGKATK